MKKLLGTLFALLLLVGCGASTAAPESAKSEPAPAAAAADEQAEADKVAEDSAPDGDYVVTIDGFKVFKDYDGESALIVDFTFTNNSDKAANFMFATNAKAFQDGIELETAIISDAKVYDSGAAMKDIKPGKSLKIGRAHV